MLDSFFVSLSPVAGEDNLFSMNYITAKHAWAREGSSFWQGQTHYNLFVEDPYLYFLPNDERVGELSLGVTGLDEVRLSPETAPRLRKREMPTNLTPEEEEVFYLTLENWELLSVGGSAAHSAAVHEADFDKTSHLLRRDRQVLRCILANGVLVRKSLQDLRSVEEARQPVNQAALDEVQSRLSQAERAEREVLRLMHHDEELYGIAELIRALIVRAPQPGNWEYFVRHTTEHPRGKVGVVAGEILKALDDDHAHPVRHESAGQRMEREALIARVAAYLYTVPELAPSFYRVSADRSEAIAALIAGAASKYPVGDDAETDKAQQVIDQHEGTVL